MFQSSFGLTNDLGKGNFEPNPTIWKSNSKRFGPLSSKRVLRENFAHL
jgi:hypothetical protein